MNEQQKKLILDWMRKVHQMEYAHRYESTGWAKYEKLIGLTAFILATVVTFSYRFPSISAQDYNNLCFILKKEFFVPFLSTVVAILTGIQTFLKPGEKADIHKRLANEYEKIRHKMELVVVASGDNFSFAKETKAIRSEWEALDAINVSNSNFVKGKEKVKSFGKYSKELDFLDNTNK